MQWKSRISKPAANSSSTAKSSQSSEAVLKESLADRPSLFETGELSHLTSNAHVSLQRCHLKDHYSCLENEFSSY